MIQPRTFDPWIWLVRLVALVVLLSGVLKLLDIKAFVHLLGAWSWLPVDSRPWIAFATPIVEVLLSGAVVLGYRRTWAGLALVVLLVLFRAAYDVQLDSGGPPTCGCFGRLGAHYPVLEQPTVVVMRDAVLILVLGAGLGLTRSRSGSLG